FRLSIETSDSVETPYLGVHETGSSSHVVAVLTGAARARPSGADNLNTLALALASYDAIRLRQSVDMAKWIELPGR
ncbi:MAG: hypothetical protein K2W77_16620, partial [Tabrizicola sp.]|nr:hypothetical protein [Tabrizicola sp.]